MYLFTKCVLRFFTFYRNKEEQLNLVFLMQPLYTLPFRYCYRNTQVRLKGTIWILIYHFFYQIDIRFVLPLKCRKQRRPNWILVSNCVVTWQIEWTLTLNSAIVVYLLFKGKKMCFIQFIFPSELTIICYTLICRNHPCNVNDIDSFQADMSSHNEV